VTAEALPCAVARLLDRFGRCWGVDPRIDLRGNLAAAHAVDVLLTFSKQRYGDHGFHAVDVCALGLLLLDAHLFGNETEPGPRLMEVVAERLSDRAGRQVEPAEVIDNWLVASLLHDVGYCLNTVSQAESLLSRLCSPPVDRFRELVAEALRAAEDGFPTDLAAMAADAGVVVPDGHGGGAQRPDHGSVSFANLLEVLLRIDRGDSYLVREPGPSPAGVVERYLPALRAVYCHAVHGHALSFDEEPLAFLLALVDELQEWNRPRRDDVTALAGGFSAWRRFGLAPPRPAPSPMRFVLADLGLAPPRDEEAGRMTPSFRFPEEGPAFHLLFERRDRAEYLPVRTVLSKAGSFQRLSATNLPWPRGIVVACLFPVPSRSDPSPSELDVYGGVRRLKRGLPRPRRAEDYLALLDRGSGRFDAFSYLRMTGNRRRTFSLRWGRGQGDWTALEDRLDGHEVFLFEVLGLGRLARPPAGTPPRPLFPADLGPYLRHVRQVQQQLDAE